MSFAKRIGDVIAKDKEIDVVLSRAKQREHILLQLRAVVLFSRKGSSMPAVPTKVHEDRICKTLNCGKPRAMNLKTGLCMMCHSRAKALVEGGATTWERLAELGLVLSAQESNDPFTQAFNEATKG